VVALGADTATTVVLSMGVDMTTIGLLAAKEQRRAGRILFVGRLVEKKGVSVLPEALRLLGATDTTERTGYDLRIVGDGPLRAKLTSEASGLSVTWVGVLGRENLVAEFGAASIAERPHRTAHHPWFGSGARHRTGTTAGLTAALRPAGTSGCDSRGRLLRRRDRWSVRSPA